MYHCSLQAITVLLPSLQCHTPVLVTMSICLAAETAVFSNRKPPRPTSHTMTISMNTRAKMLATDSLSPEKTHDDDC
ncbi:hypothetical protein EDB81DRAFT_798631 [Dactylonectria macrodidyma]|uniref:Uncharacterized protein n=1 Tax=Dactylonectria macrodidyma TaxID=307937 RepID=A0A9P9EM87_9HYPO|nr:hypothetical protein EDB81DRAFT_798631 [Dactylonectria macrodidyma]